MSLETYSKREKEIARQAFDKARFREYEAIGKEVRARAVKADDPDELWDLHDYLTQKRKEMGQKYDYRYSVLLFVFVQLLREGWLKENELDGLAEEKLQRIKQLRAMFES